MIIIHLVEPSCRLPRALAPAVARALEVFRVVVIVGPRQVGKTTLVQEPRLAAGRFYGTLDDLDLLAEARNAPDRLLGRAARITLDEVQRAPELLMAIKRSVDREPRRGAFLVTGSADLRAMKQVADHLPGRAVYLHLEPMSAGELRGEPEPVAMERLFKARDAKQARDVIAPDLVPAASRRRTILDDAMVRGGLPEPAMLDDESARQLWFGSYVRSWLERGVSELSAISELADLRRLMQALAARTGRLLNQAEVASDVGLARTTGHRYVNVLALGLLLELLPAYSGSLRVTTIKAPKLYWRDVGLACHLLSIRGRGDLAEHPLRGALLENLLLANLRAWSSARSEPVTISFWRTTGGREVDFVLGVDDRVIPIEVKGTGITRTDDLRHLEPFLELHRRRAPFGVVLHEGTTVETPAPNVVALPLATVL
jgi:hypothetical protein